MMKRILIIGGGYAGTEIIRQLVLRGVRGTEVELISAERYFENTIAGTEVISEKLGAEDLRYDLQLLSGYWGFSLTVGRAVKINLDEKVVKLENGERDYDLLVVASGSAPNFYDVKGFDLVLPSYRLFDFERINRRLKQLSPDRPRVIVVGAGYVGLEVAAEVMDFFKSSGRKAEVIVVEKTSHVLPGFNNEAARRMALEALSSRGMGFNLGKGVKRIAEGKVVLEDGSELQSDLTIWSGGVRGSELALNTVGASLHDSYIDVDEKLLIRGRLDAFAIGDAAYVEISGSVAQKMAGEALEQAVTTARNIMSVVGGQKPSVEHKINYSVDFPKVLLSLGEGKALLIFGPHYASLGSTEYFLKRRIDVEEMMDRFPRKS
jgi:NADH dehydrogenase